MMCLCQPLEYQIENGIKIFAMLKNHKSAIISGNCWSGKSTTIQMLVAALQKNKTPDFSSIKVPRDYGNL